MSKDLFYLTETKEDSQLDRNPLDVKVSCEKDKQKRVILDI